MRDEKDLVTGDLLPAKRGRPCLDSEKGPMTAAEKQRRYRESKNSAVYALRNMVSKEPNFVRQGADQDIVAAIAMDISFRGKPPTSAAKRRIVAFVAELSRRYPQK